MQLRESLLSSSSPTIQAGMYTLPSREGIASDYQKEQHTQVFLLLSFFQNGDIYSHVRGFLAGTTPVLLN